MAGDDDLDVARDVVQQPKRGDVVLDRVGGSAVQVEHRNQDVGEHVAGDENPALLDEQRRMARGMRPMLDDPHLRAVPRNLRRLGGQGGDEAVQVQRDLIGDFRLGQVLGDAGLRVRVGQLLADSVGAAGRGVAGGPRRAAGARAGGPSADASRNQRPRSGPNRTGRSRGRPIRGPARRGR
jgi:hypothetical protein